MTATLISAFDTWRPGYGLAVVSIFQANTTVLASVFTDEALTVPAANPQTLIERVIDTPSSVSYGRFAQPLYVGVPYQLQINTVDQTGIERPPLTTLVGQDASEATVVVTGGTQTVNLDDTLARRIDVRDFGAFVQVGQQGASSATNNLTLQTALAAAGGGGGYVEVPSGTYQVIAFTVPQGVVLRGQGRVATTLQSTLAGNVAVIGGLRAGLSRLTLDGVSLITNSVGVQAQNIDQVVLDDVEIKRFDTGIYRQGGKLAEWSNLYLSNCNIGAKLHGESFNSQGAGTAPLTHNTWRGGQVDTCGVTGVELVFVDSNVQHNTIEDVLFTTNTGTAVKVTGAQWSVLRRCDWTLNTSNLVVADAPLTLTAFNVVIGIDVFGGSMGPEVPAVLSGNVVTTPAVASTMTLTGTLGTVAFRQMDLETVAVTITNPAHNVVVEDCLQNGLSFSGVPTVWTSKRSDGRGATFGVTTGNAATEAWRLPLLPGQQVYLEGKIVGRQRNGVNTAFFHISVSAGEPGATLNYDAQTANFTLGAIVTGGTSGATARITAATNSGVSGSLTLQDINGTFLDDETLTDTSAGTALVNGTITINAAALVGTVLVIRAQKTDINWLGTFVATGNSVVLQVTGDTSQTIEWTGNVDVVST